MDALTLAKSTPELAYVVKVAGAVGVLFGNAANPTRGKTRQRATRTDIKDRNLNERYKGCFRRPSRRGVVELPVDGVMPLGMERDVLASKRRG